MSINRVTGTNSGIDTEAVVKASLTTEQNKIDKAYQQQKVYEYQQEQLKEIVNQCTDFYDKYLDILSNDSLLKSSAYESASFTASDSSVVSAVGYAGCDVTDYEVNVTKLASTAKATLSKGDINNDKYMYISDGNKTICVSLNDEKGDKKSLDTIVKDLNAELKNNGLNITAKYTQFDGGNIILESGNMGSGQKIEVAFNSEGLSSEELKDTSKTDQLKFSINETGSDAEGTITKNGMTYTINGRSNTITVDNVQFTLKSEGTSKLKGTMNTTKLKDTIVNFVNDYNKLIQTINDKLLEKRDSDYMPLTEEQKEEMTESEIKKWEQKAQTGLLRNDNDLKRIQSALKDSMRTFMSSSGLNLEAIGIKPVDNYGSKNGTFTIDEDKLNAAIEKNPEGVKDLFTRAADSTATKNSSGGILVQLQKVLKDETKISGSSLSKRIGFSGTSTENNNTLKKNIDNQKKLISELKSKYTSKENALYKKYSALETMLEKLNAQSNSLYSMLNIG